MKVTEARSSTKRKLVWVWISIGIGQGELFNVDCLDGLKFLEIINLMCFQGIPDDWDFSLTQKSALLNAGQRIDVTLTVQPPDDAPVCDEVRIDVTSWEAIGNTLVPIGGGVVQVETRERTNFAIQAIDTCTYYYKK